MCGGRLDSDPYPRKPRVPATVELPAEYHSRFSYSCGVRTCRKRHTPASTRFLGRRIYLGVIVVLATAMLTLLVSGWRYRGRPTAPLSFGVGAFAGVCSGAAQVGGPAVIAYWLGSHSPPATIRANIILYFAISTTIAMVTYYFGGVLTLTVLKLCLVVAPVYALGLFIGARLFGVADESVFRRICYALIAVAVLVSLPVLDGVVR